MIPENSFYTEIHKLTEKHGLIVGEDNKLKSATLGEIIWEKICGVFKCFGATDRTEGVQKKFQEYVNEYVDDIRNAANDPSKKDIHQAILKLAEQAGIAIPDSPCDKSAEKDRKVGNTIEKINWLLEKTKPPSPEKAQPPTGSLGVSVLPLATPPLILKEIFSTHIPPPNSLITENKPMVKSLPPNESEKPSLLSSPASKSLPKKKKNELPLLEISSISKVYISSVEKQTHVATKEQLKADMKILAGHHKDKIKLGSSEKAENSTDSETKLKKLTPIGKPPSVIEPFLKGWSGSAIHAYHAQQADTSPLFSPKVFWNSIDAQNLFFKKSICPSLKCLSYLFTSDQQEATQLYTKWETGLKNLAILWKASGSENEQIDWISFNRMNAVKNVLLPINHLLNFISKLPMNVTDFLKKTENLDIPDEMEPLVISDAEATTLLNCYLVNPATNLTALFPQGSKMYRWPAECQFAIALLYLTEQYRLTKIVNDAVEKQKEIDTFDKLLKMTSPRVVTRLAAAASNSITLTAFLALAPKFIPKPSSYTDQLKKILPYQTSDHWRSIITHAIAFSQTPVRKQFDDQFNAFQHAFILDGITAIKSKYSNNEVDLAMLVKLFINIDQDDYMRKTKSYLENSDDPHLKQEAKKSHGKVLMETVKIVKVLSPTLTKNSNTQTILTALDQSVLPSLRQNPPVNLENESILNRIQNILAPLNNLV